MNRTVNRPEQTELKTFIFIEEDEQECIENDWYYYLIDIIDNTLYVVNQEKYDLFLRVEGTADELFYLEAINESEMKEIEI